MKGKVQRIGIFGGTFDPLHFGHYWAIEDALLFVDEVWITLTWKHPLGKKMVDMKHRKKMCELAFGDMDNTKIYCIPYKERNRLIYTYDIIEKLNKEWAYMEFAVIIGQDELRILDSWYKYDELIKKSVIISLLSYGGMGIKTSSSQIRQDVDEYVWALGSGVHDYIKEKGLYQEK